ncbi:Plasmodium exported protein (PHIST), unknown, putative [Plasmodium sp. gorilla clade G3]|nr:Plasmodium exported protein (PHIST), unknown, putative [Plasmodium sp. gorilla clade G3]
MKNKKHCILFPFYHDNENNKGKLHYISFKFLCLSLYIIGFYYIFLNISLENKSLEIVKISNLYERNLGEAEKNNKSSKRKRNLKHKKEDVSKTKSKENNTKSNEPKVEDKKYSTGNDMENTKVENKSNSSVCNINYNDMSRKLTEKELHDVLNSLETCPSKDDLRNIWNHTIGVAKEGLDDIQKELKASIQKYLDNDILEKINGYGNKLFLYDNILKGNTFRLCQTVSIEELLYTKDFFSLINGKHTIDDVLKFIYSFLEHIETLKKELYKKHQKELLADVEQQWYLWEHRNEYY